MADEKRLWRLPYSNEPGVPNDGSGHCHHHEASPYIRRGDYVEIPVPSMLDYPISSSSYVLFGLLHPIQSAQEAAQDRLRARIRATHRNPWRRNQRLLRHLLDPTWRHPRNKICANADVS